MDLILIVLLLILSLLSYFIIIKDKKFYKKFRKTIYLFLFIIILILLIFIRKSKENFQTGGKKKRSQTSKKGQESKATKLKRLCGLPVDDPRVAHCFADGTHHTCCKLGQEARDYADRTGNGIGKLSEEVFKTKNGRKPRPGEKTSWCTCFGSKVCSTYAKDFNDGTKIDFINNPNHPNKIRKNVHSDCEGYFRRKFSVGAHGTPGVIQGDTELGRICEESSHSSVVRVK